MTGGYKKTTRCPLDWHEGDAVQITGGRFKGQRGTLMRISIDRERPNDFVYSVLVGSRWLSYGARDIKRVDPEPDAAPEE